MYAKYMRKYNLHSSQPNEIKGKSEGAEEQVLFYFVWELR